MNAPLGDDVDEEPEQDGGGHQHQGQLDARGDPNAEVEEPEEQDRPEDAPGPVRGGVLPPDVIVEQPVRDAPDAERDRRGQCRRPPVVHPAGQEPGLFSEALRDVVVESPRGVDPSRVGGYDPADGRHPDDGNDEEQAANHHQVSLSVLELW